MLYYEIILYLDNQDQFKRLKIASSQSFGRQINVGERGKGFGVLSPNSYVILGKLLSISEPQLSHP